MNLHKLYETLCYIVSFGVYSRSHQVCVCVNVATDCQTDLKATCVDGCAHTKRADEEKQRIAVRFWKNGREFISSCESQEEGVDQRGIGEIHQRCKSVGVSLIFVFEFMIKKSVDFKELVERIIQMETHNQQLKNIIKKGIINKSTASDAVTSVVGSGHRKFDFKK